MKIQIDAYLQRNLEEMIDAVSHLIQIPSVAVFDEPPYPYGIKCAQALDFCSTLCKEKGLVVKNFDYRCLEASLNTSVHGKKITFAAHADVVPSDFESLYPPFGGLVQNGYIIGRGAVDNKAPLIAVIYALAFFKEHTVPLKNRFSLLIGSNEEQGMDDIDYYLARNTAPDLAIAVDDDFPVVNAQRGVMRFSVESEASSTLESLVTEKRFWHQTADSCLLSCIDGSIHYFFVADGNPVSQLLCHMQQKQLPLFQDALLNDSVRLLLPNSHFPCVLSILHSKSVSLIPTNIELTTNRTIKLSYALTFTHEVDFEVIKQALKLLFGCKRPQFQTNHLSYPYHIPQGNEIISLLTDLYNLHSKTNYAPYTMKGITYAGKFPFGLGFGAGNPHEQKPFPSGYGTCHNPDEAHSIETFLHAVEIYIYSILDLDKFYQRNKK